jgi:hypothetical protein
MPNGEWDMYIAPPTIGRLSKSIDLTVLMPRIERIHLAYTPAADKLFTKIVELKNEYICRMARDPKYLILHYKKYLQLAAYNAYCSRQGWRATVGKWTNQQSFLPSEIMGLKIIIRQGPMSVAGDAEDDFMYQSQQNLYKKENNNE